ncbi:S-M checkpoint control protein rad4 [Zalerion maritima]|uniref:S-M checkpoint control protein rad4 n=1 Tax=Zalerion maritima TaxID=339359 RepID=A0AAD5RWS8_9PEZI|nr:S-M checkpoint control protein rad4 [Zalerion maritima]
MGSGSALTPPTSSGGVAASSRFDPQQPFKGVVSEVDKRVVQLGGCHKYDLTPDITHLVVGDYDTPKYRHVARERPDVTPIAAGWIQVVMDLWKEDLEIDFTALEDTWRLKSLESSGSPLLSSSAVIPSRGRGRLMVCLTGFDDPDERQSLISKINDNGGTYTGDLTRKVTHLIVRKPEGRKYMAARNWGVKCVASQWLHESIERGMILAEDCYDPLLPPQKLGEGAWTRKRIEKAALGKRLRDGPALSKEDGVRKLRKTASMKLQSQSQDMWASILGASTPAGPLPAVFRSDEPSQSRNYEPTQLNPRSMDATEALPAAKKNPTFATSAFYTHGYNANHNAVVKGVIQGLGGRLCSSLEEAVAIQSPDITHRFLVVPQASQTKHHPKAPDGFHAVTEFYLEKCLHKKQFLEPTKHVLGRPFPAFPISKFAPLSIAIGGFTDVDLQQVEKAITQLGATFAERFTSKAHVLVCNDLSAVRQQKINLALSWKVPVVTAEWLWDCIQLGSRIPLKQYLVRQLHQRVDVELPGSPTANNGGGKDRASLQRTFSEPAPKTEKKTSADIMFNDGRRTGAERVASCMTAVTSAGFSFQTANTHLGASKPIADAKQSGSDSFKTAPATQKTSNNADAKVGDGFKRDKGLTAATGSSLNRSPSPQKSSTKQTALQYCSDEGMPIKEVDEEEHFSEKNALNPRAKSCQVDPDLVVQGQFNPMREDGLRAEQLRWEKEARKKAERKEIENKLMTAILTDGATSVAFATASDGAEGGEEGLQYSHTGLGLGRKRKRGVFGRAISNTSAVSSGSDCPHSAVPVAPLPVPAGMDNDSRLGGEGDIQEDSLMADAPPRPPPSTQIGYAEPSDRKRLLQKMKGEDCDGEGDDDPERRKAASMTIGQFDKMRQQGMFLSSSGRKARKRTAGF